MSIHPKVRGKKVPPEAGAVYGSRGRLPARACGRAALGTNRFNSGPLPMHPSQAAREENPVLLGTCAHDGGKLYRLGLRQCPHFEWPSGKELENVW
jgi:hypothetical protein